jgi:hypothetical protein
LENNYFIEAPAFLIMLIFIFSFMVAVVWAHAVFKGVSLFPLIGFV